MTTVNLFHCLFGISAVCDSFHVDKKQENQLKHRMVLHISSIDASGLDATLECQLEIKLVIYASCY